MRMTAAEMRQMMAPPKRSKYGNTPIVVDGVRFDSKAEAKYYQQLLLRERTGEVYGLERQKPFVITVDGKLICTLKVDFYYYDQIKKSLCADDVKGAPETAVFRLKAKLVKAFYGIDVNVVRIK